MVPRKVAFLTTLECIEPNKKRCKKFGANFD